MDQGGYGLEEGAGGGSGAYDMYANLGDGDGGGNEQGAPYDNGGVQQQQQQQADHYASPAEPPAPHHHQQQQQQQHMGMGGGGDLGYGLGLQGQQQQQDDGFGSGLKQQAAYDADTLGQHQHQQHQHHQQQQDGGGALGQGGAAVDLQQQVQYWKDAFFKLARVAGAAVDPHAAEQPAEHYIQQAQAAQQQDPWGQVQAREAALQVQNAHLSRENLLLRRELCCGWAAADPNIIQVRQMYLDPAIAQEFARMRSDLALRTAEAASYKAKHEAATFNQDSKTGQALLNKVKLLAAENEELGRQRREGLVAAQGALVSLERQHADELRKALVEVKEHCGYLEDENAELGMLATLNQRRIDDLKDDLARAGGQGSDAGQRPRLAAGSSKERERERPAQDKEQPRERERERDRERDRERERPADRRESDRDRERERDRERDRSEARERGVDRRVGVDRRAEYARLAGGRGHRGAYGGRAGASGGRGQKREYGR